MNMEFIEILKKIGFGNSYILVMQDTDVLLDEVVNGLCEVLDIKKYECYVFENIDGIKIKDVKEIRKKIYLSSASGKRVVLLNNAHNITTEAANAFLKTLEEPSKQTVFVLITDNANKLLDTINSRCQKIVFRKGVEKNLNNRYINLLTKIFEAEDYAGLFDIVKKIVASDIDIINLLNDWTIYLRKNRVKKNLLLIKIITEYVKIYSTGLNKKLFLENLLIDIYESNKG